MIRRCPQSYWTVAAIPFLLLSTSQQTGIITHLHPDGSAERLVYVRAAASRADEAAGLIRDYLPAADLHQRVLEGEGERVLAWRDGVFAGLSRVGDIEIGTTSFLQSPLSLYTTHTWKETLTFDRGDATDVEVHGVGLAELTYIVRMPGTITTSTPPAKTEGNKCEWAVKVQEAPQTFTAESRSFRWGYAILWAYVLLFVLVKLIAVLPGFLSKLPRKPHKI